jgi:hypothetical protein
MGKAFFLCVVASMAMASQWQDTSKSQYKVTVPLVYEIYGTMFSKMISVPEVPNMIAYVCFKTGTDVHVQCLYIDPDKGTVQQTSILPLESSL